jgi:short-chain fatty acids transporter
MLRSAGTILAERLRRWIPDSLVFALALTLLTAGLAWGVAGASGAEVLDAWYRGFWTLLEFGMQIVLVLATGYAIALSPLVARGIDALAARIRSPVQVYFLVMVLGSFLVLVSWSWVVVVAVLARELARRVAGLDYAYLTACVFASSWSWVCGLSSSIPLLLNTEGNFLIETGVLDATIGVDVTLGSPLNLWYFAVGLAILPALMVAARPAHGAAVPLEARLDGSQPRTELTVAEEADELRPPRGSLADRLDHGLLLPAGIVLLGGAWLVRHFAARGFDVDLEVMIFAFLMLGLAVHRTPMRYVTAMKRACSNVSGIVFQYPFYAGIMGIMTFTELGSLTAERIAAGTSLRTLPAAAQLLAALVNFAVPSAGGEWAVIGPPLVETARTLGAGSSPEELQALIARVAMSVAYGETSTNMLQPFYLLVILPVMGAGVRIQARDVLGHLVVPFLAVYAFTLVLLLFAPL